MYEELLDWLRVGVFPDISIFSKSYFLFNWEVHAT